MSKDRGDECPQQGQNRKDDRARNSQAHVTPFPGATKNRVESKLVCHTRLAQLELLNKIGKICLRK
jgi:hypothetical protein